MSSNVNYWFFYLSGQLYIFLFNKPSHQIYNYVCERWLFSILHLLNVDYWFVWVRWAVISKPWRLNPVNQSFDSRSWRHTLLKNRKEEGIEILLCYFNARVGCEWFFFFHKRAEHSHVSSAPTLQATWILSSMMLFIFLFMDLKQDDW